MNLLYIKISQSRLILIYGKDISIGMENTKGVCMAKGYFTATPLGLGGIEAVKQKIAGSKMFNADDWNKYLAQGKIAEYVQTISDFEKKVNYDTFANELDGIKYLTSDQKLLAMQNELYGNKLDKVEKTKEIVNEDGTKSTQKFETTEYDYVKGLLQSQVAYNKATALYNESAQLKASRDKVGDVFKAIPQGLLEGGLSKIGAVYNIFEGVINAIAAGVSTQPSDLDASGNIAVVENMDKAFRAAFAGTGWDETAIDWLRKNIFFYEEGDYAQGFARYTYSAAESFGALIPGMILNGAGQLFGATGKVATGLAKTAQVSYYTGMASSNMQELFRDDTMLTRPTLELIANASIKTAFEIGVEKTLGVMFGNTSLDNIAFGYGTVASSGITAKNAIARIAKDALQEGMEEYFQDYSAYFTDQVFSIWAEDYKGCSDWTLQGAFDAFVLGAAMSLGGSLARAATTKRVSTGEIDEKTGKYKKLGKLQSFEYNLTMRSMLDTINELDFDKMSTDEQVSVIGGLYTTMRAITSLYGTFGEERMAVAEKILNRVQQGKKVTSEDVRNSITKLSLELQLGKEKYQKAEEIKELTNLMAIEAVIKGTERKNKAELAQEIQDLKLAGEVVTITKKSTKQEIAETLDVSDNVVDTIQKMLNGTGKELIVVQNGTGITETETSVIAAKQCLETFDADTNMRTLSEQRIIKAVLIDREVSDAFNDIREIMVGPNGTPYTPQQFMTMLLYDDNFAYSVLYNGDKDLVRLISRLDTIAKFLVKENGIENITKQDIAIVKERLHKVLYNFYKGAPYVTQGDVEQSTILSSDEKKQLKANNWQRGIYANIMDRNEFPSKEDLNVLEIMVNAYKTDESTKQKMLSDLKSTEIEVVKTALKKLVTEFETNFKGVYNGHIYLEYDGNPLKAEFNTFLKQHNVTIDQILSGDLDPALAQQVMATQGSVSPSSCVKYFQDLYKNEYRHEFVPDFTKGTVVVKEGFARSYGSKTALQQATDISADIDYKAETALIKKSYNLPYDIFGKDVTKFQKMNATIDDVIKDPRLQSDTVKADVKAKYGDNSPMHTFMYLRDFIFNKSGGNESILVDNSGNYYIATIAGSDKVGAKALNDNRAFKSIDEALQEAQKDEIDGTADVDISECIDKKYLSVFGKDNAPEVIFEAMAYREDGEVVIDRTTYGYYDEDSNTIIINSNAFRKLTKADLEGLSENQIARLKEEVLTQNRKQFRWTLLHEFRHALQANNGLTLGFGEFLPKLARRNKAGAEAIIKDMRKHFPTAFGNEYNYKKDLETADQILYQLSGEMGAVGYERELNMYPLVIKRTSTGQVQKIIMPWGTEYDRTGVVSQKVVSKSLKYEAGTGYVMTVNNVVNDSAMYKRVQAEIKHVLGNELRRQGYTNEMAIAKRAIFEGLRSTPNITNPEVFNRFWANIEQKTGLRFDQEARRDWANFNSLGNAEKLVLSVYPTTSPYSVDTEFVPVPVLQIRSNSKTQYIACTNIGGDNIGTAVKELQRGGYIDANASVKVSVENIQVGSLFDAFSLTTNTIRLRSDFTSVPATKMIKLDNIIKGKTVTILGLDNIQTYADKVLSTYDSSDRNLIGSTNRRLAYVNRDMLTDIEQNTDLKFDDWYSKNKDKATKAEVAYYQRFKDGTFDKAEFHSQFMQYLHDVFDVQKSALLNEYMWNSGMMSASDPRATSNLKDKLATEIKSTPGMYQKMMNIARFQIAPMLSYNEFMNTDIPFVRVTTQTESGKRAFSGASLGTVNLDTQLGLVTSGDTTPYKLYVGTVKPKQALGFTTSGEYEVLLPTDITQSADKYTIVAKNDKFYLLGEEYGDIAEQIKDVDMRSAEGVPLDTTFSFFKNSTGKSRYVSHEAAQNSNLKYYVKPNQVIQMDPRMQALNANSTGIEETLDRNFVNMIKNGRLRTKSDLYKYIRRAWNIDYYRGATKEYRAKLEATFKLINDNYFGNTAISNLKTLLVLMDQGMADYYAARVTILKYAEVHPENTKISKLLTTGTTAESLNMVINYIKTAPELKELFGKLKTAFNLYRGMEYIDTYEGKKAMLVPMMARFDGTLESAGLIARDIRWTGIKDIQSKYAGKAKVGKEGEEELDAYENTADTSGNNLSGIVKQEEKVDWLINYYIDKDLEGRSWKSTQEAIVERNKLYQKYNDSFDEFTDSEIDAMYADAITSESVGRKVTSKNIIKESTGAKPLTVRGTYEHARSTARKIISRLTTEQLAKFVEKHPDLGITADGKFKYPEMQKVSPTMGLAGAENVLLMRRDFNAKLDEALEEVLAGKYGTKSEQKIIASQKKRIEKLEADLAAAMNQKAKGKQVEVIVEGSGLITSMDSTTVPNTLQKVFETEFSETAKTEVKYFSDEDDYHFKRNYETFVDQNAETLMELTEQDVDEILNFYEKYSLAPSGESSETFIRFNAIRQYMIMYIYKLGEDNMIPLSDANKKRIETMFKAIKSSSGTELSISREAQEIINPTAMILKSLQKIYGIEVDDQDIDDLRMTVKRDYTARAKAANMDVDEYRVQEMNKILRKIEKDAIVKLQGKPRNKVDMILKWQRAAMLSSIGTWARNAASNVLLDITNKASDGIGNFTFGLLDKLTKSDQKRKLPTDQYRITGTKLDKTDASDRVLIDFIDKTIRASGIMDLIADGLTKYDASATAHKSSAPSEVLAQLIVNSTISKLSNENTFPEGNHWWSKPFMAAGNGMAKLLYGYTDKNGKVHKGVMTDTKAVMKSFYSYLGKMLKEDFQSGRITANDLSKGLNSRAIIDLISNAYVMASWDYMHKANFFNKLDGLIRKYTGDGGYFIWKQIEPFAAAGWNWFMKGLDYTPIGLVRAIKNYIKLENFAKKMDADKEMQVAPSSRFATYLVKRQLGSGIIGTIGTIAGCFLAGLGVAGIDDDDGKPKLYIGNLSVDISNIFGTSGMLAGIAMGGAFIQAKSKNQSWFEAVIEGMVSSFDSMFIDSVFSDVFDLMQSRETFTQVLMNRAGSSFAMFVPNLLKTALSYSTVVTPKYSSGILGQLERQMVQILPSLAYALPRRYDIYTGELQYKYNMPWMDRWYDAIAGVAVNYGTPIKVKRRVASQLEVLATSLGVSKGELTGRYNDIGNLTTEQTGRLNLYYGKLNNNSLNKFINNQEKYYVENEKGTRVNLYYNQMTDKQKKSVITRIMSDNAKYAKVYIGTQMGYKYYGTEDEVKKLIQLGVRNVYIKSDTRTGFVK